MKLIMIDGHKLKKFIIAGANRLNKNKDYVDALNVFPVPDGDTGTNMSLTVTSAAQEVSKVNSPNVYDVAKALSSGSLRGARGNSGVILSQLFRGFSKSLEGKELVNTKELAQAFQNGVESAYKAVMKPKEGTILTVSRAISDKAIEMADKTDDVVEMMKEVISYANGVLDKTVNMLPELKQAGVVDAGGKGLLSILEGGLFDKHNYVEIELNTESTNQISSNITDLDIKFAYCTEFFINLKNNEQIEEDLKSYLATMGDSVVLASDDEFIKVHVHTNNPGKILERALKVGSLDNIKIENMRTQHSNLIDFSVEEEEETEEAKEFGFVSVSIGDGINELFGEFGVEQIITGGQTMNPSIEDILTAVEKVNAKNVFILPNNKNIILAAKQAKEVYNKKNIIVLETTSVAEGFTALTAFLTTIGVEENINNMKEAISNVQTGQVTYAVRETKIDNLDIKENDILCILNGKINNVSEDVAYGTKDLIAKMVTENEDASIITLYYGEEISEKQASEMEAFLTEKYKELDIEVIYGGQPLYYYIISVE